MSRLNIKQNTKDLFSAIFLDICDTPMTWYIHSAAQIQIGPDNYHKKQLHKYVIEPKSTIKTFHTRYGQFSSSHFNISVLNSYKEKFYFGNWETPRKSTNKLLGFSVDTLSIKKLLLRGHSFWRPHGEGVGDWKKQVNIDVGCGCLKGAGDGGPWAKTDVCVHTS